MKAWAWEFRFPRKCWRLCIRGERFPTLNGKSIFLESLFIRNHSCAFAVSQSQGVDRNVMKYLLCSVGLRTTGPTAVTVFSLQRWRHANLDIFSVRVDTVCLNTWHVMELLTVWMPLMKPLVVSVRAPVALFVWNVCIWPFRPRLSISHHFLHEKAIGIFSLAFIGNYQFTWGLSYHIQIVPSSHSSTFQ